jgi:ATP-binding cassette subfamily B protein
MTLSWALASPMRNLGMLLNDIQRFFASANKVIELYYAKPEIADLPDAVDVDGPSKGGVTFRHVTFKYGREKVLDDVSFDIKPGQTVGIIGPTGSGKTTIANLIMRFYDANSGSVMFDGIDVKRYRLSRLRSSIAMATQDVFLFSDTVDGNIAYNDPDMPEEQVLRCAEEADCDEFIKGMTDGYNTIIGERGIGLSGGQRQRLALARALAKQPALLILDDTTSAVDLETEKLIQKNLADLPFECTKIIIAQRISSIKDADRIMVVRHHRIEEEGTHEQLIEKHGYYYSVNRLQKNGFDTLGEGELDGEE